MAISEKVRKKLLKKKQELADRGKGMGYESFKEGKKCMRIVNFGEDSDFAIEVTHFYLNKELGGFISPSSFGNPCPALEAYEKLKKSKDEDDNSTATDIKPRKMTLTAGLISKDDRGKDWDMEKGNIKGAKGVTLIKITGGQYSELIEWMLDEDAGDFTDPKEGYPIKVTRIGTGQYDTEYKQLALKPQALPKELRKQTFDLEELVKSIVPSYEQIEEKVKAFLGASMDDDDEDEKPKKKKKSKLADKKEELKKKKKKKKTSDI